MGGLPLGGGHPERAHHAPYKLLRSVMQQPAHAGYVVAGSAVTAMKQMVRSHESPLFLRLRAIELPPLTAEDTQVLATKIEIGVHGEAILTLRFGHDGPKAA